jgi:hypothetical protein
MSLFINGSRPYNFELFRNGTLLYILLTAAWALIYYSGITAFILITHPASISVILVTVALAWAVILEPARAYVQSLIEQRFNVRSREASKAICSDTG